MNETLVSIAKSWCETERCMHTLENILAWVSERNRTVAVDIRKTDLEHCTSWFYDWEEGCIRNRDHSFFSIAGFRQSDGAQELSQPIILQQEIGYLGIICKELNGVMHFLMQAKIEPGNVNKIQLSPTIQATKSNFTQKHGGKKPPYHEFFLNADRYEIVVDQIQSEQSSRFLKKRNRNIIIRVEKEIEVLPSHHWMTLGQIKRLMRVDNLVNMDTRTVLSCIPFSRLDLSHSEQAEFSERFLDKSLFYSVFVGAERNPIPQVYQFINNQKMFDNAVRELVPLHEIFDWEMKGGELVCKHPYPFKVVFCDIAIEGREVRHWTQPLFEAMGSATFGLICREDNGILKFLVHATREVGCFDVLELGPTVQREACGVHEDDEITALFMDRLDRGDGVLFDHLLSEEGGRFYHEQNRNVLMLVDHSELSDPPMGYFWMDYKTLNNLVQINNTMNIQLRNLLSLLEA